MRLDLLDHLTEDPGRSPLGGVGIFHCRSAQSLRDVPIHQPTAILVLGGRKTLQLGSRSLPVAPGELLLLPGGCNVEIGNHPEAAGREYLALALTFSHDAVAQFRRSYGELPLATDPQPQWSATAPEPVIAAVNQWLKWCMQHPVDPLIARHRQVEILLLLANAGIANNLLCYQSNVWSERVAQLLALNPGHDWSADEVCRRLGIGASTLRRRLNEEGGSFRKLLEESRMVAALALLQETFWPVGQVAAAVGYESHSRFSERFKQRFGISPTDIKKSRESVHG